MPAACVGHVSGAGGGSTEWGTASALSGGGREEGETIKEDRGTSSSNNAFIVSGHRNVVNSLNDLAAK